MRTFGEKKCAERGRGEVSTVGGANLLPEIRLSEPKQHVVIYYSMIGVHIDI